MITKSSIAGYTPGPWSFYTKPQPNGCPIVGSRGLMICMLAHTINQPEQKEVAIANARLIAAAPALVEALEDLCSEIGECGMTERARAALRAAGVEL